MVSRRKKRKIKKTRNKKKEPVFDLSQETKNSIWGIIGFALAILSVLAFFDKAGIAGRLFFRASGSLFGWGLFLIPLGFTLLGISFLKSVSRKIYSSAVLGTILFILSFLAIFYIIGDGTIQERISQSGYLGVALGFPIFKSFGFTASFITLIFLIFVSLLVSLNIPIHRFITKKEEDEEEYEDTKDGQPLKDKVVIRRGAEIVDDKEESNTLKTKIAKSAMAVKTSIEEKEFVIKTARLGKWALPPIELLYSDSGHPRSGDISANVNIIKRTLLNFNIDVEMGEVSVGPTVTQYTLRPAVGVKISKITSLQNDLSLALAAHPIRVEAPIPGKSLVGIEVPNKKTATVGLRNLIDIDEFRKSKYFLPIALGKDVAGFPVYAGLEKMPHLLIAGATGSGKSVCINSLMISLLYKHSPDMLKFILIDPKRVELSLYNGIPHLITPVITDSKKVVNALKWAVREMEKRYEVISQVGARDIFSYNTKQAAKNENLMPFIVIIIDELADLMAAYGRDIEATIVRLAQMSRAVGLHLIVSTQRPSVEVITGLIKANITSRIAFRVASSIDSRTILDGSGSERLLGNGDMLFQSGETTKPKRIQSPFVTEKEIKTIVKFVKDQAKNIYTEEEDKDELKVELAQAVQGGAARGEEDVGDELYGDAKKTVILAKKASASLLQRRLRVGYARAARLLDILEEKGIVGPGEGAKPREVYVDSESLEHIVDSDYPRRAQQGLRHSQKIEDDGATAQVVSEKDSHEL